MTTFTSALSSAYANGKGSLVIAPSANGANLVQILSLANVALTMDNNFVYATDVQVSNSFSANSLTITGNTFTMGTVNATANGFCYLPGGLILQWGTVNANSSTGTLTYPTPFSTNAYSIGLTPNSAGVTDYVATQNSSQASVRTSVATAATPVQFMVIGI